jgi:pSer/pThr/pTyr-binding forkhead associated (FHA) protein
MSDPEPPTIGPLRLLPAPADLPPLQLLLQPSGLAIKLNRPSLVVGRHSTADVRLPLADISRRHCRLEFENGAWHLYDLNSLNGVYVNGDRVSEVEIHPGDTIRLGGFTFLVDHDDPESTEGAPDAEPLAEPQRLAS